MMRNGIISFHIVFLLLPLWAFAGTYNPIIEQIKPGNIVFIGESHQRPESPQLIKRLVDAAIARHQCLTVGLEISRDQQPTIDDVVKGRAAVSDIKIPFAIDHPGIRDLIEQLGKIKEKSPCLGIEAIDARDADNDRDENMANRLAELPSNNPILVLVGGLHTLKKVTWTIRSGEPYVAEILVKRGFNVKSYPQHWLSGKCEAGRIWTSRYVNGDASETLKLLNKSLMSLINAKPHRSTKEVIDGFMVWECR
jgi:hypothetical protein